MLLINLILKLFMCLLVSTSPQALAQEIGEEMTETPYPTRTTPHSHPPHTTTTPHRYTTSLRPPHTTTPHRYTTTTPQKSRTTQRRTRTTTTVQPQ